LSRPELIKKLKEKHPKLNISELKLIIDTFCKSTENALVRGATIELRVNSDERLLKYSCGQLKAKHNQKATEKIIETRFQLLLGLSLRYIYLYLCY